jgi:hypothetical protein
MLEMFKVLKNKLDFAAIQLRETEAEIEKEVESLRT